MLRKKKTLTNEDRDVSNEIKVFRLPHCFVGDERLEQVSTPTPIILGGGFRGECQAGSFAAID